MTGKTTGSSTIIDLKGRLPLSPNREVPQSSTSPFSATPSCGDTPQRPMIICLTGQMAAGKNYISSLLENENCVSIDLDKTVHMAIELCKEPILKSFSTIASDKNITLLNEDGSINRRNLGVLLFADKNLLAIQEAILYPKVIEIVNAFVSENTALGKTVLINATVLYKTPELMNLCDCIYFVTAPFLKRLIRARQRDHMAYRQILRRFKSQKNLLKDYKKTGKQIYIIKN